MTSPINLPPAPQFIDESTAYNLGVFRGYNNITFMCYEGDADNTYTDYKQGEHAGKVLRKEANFTLFLTGRET